MAGCHFSAPPAHVCEHFRSRKVHDRRRQNLSSDGRTDSFDEQKALPSVRGTVTFVSINPAGIGTGCLNSASDAMDSIRKRLVPSSVHCWSGQRVESENARSSL